MTVAGIIAEYNPFHNGHAHHIAAVRVSGATHIVAVLGGHFTQRGAPALLPKADRVRMALKGGVDLVIELPLPWAAAAAERFAFGGAALLDSMGCVDNISFGCEAGAIEPLLAVVDAMESPAFPAAMHDAMKEGLSFPAAQQRAVAALTDDGTAAVLSHPNNTLGVAYCQALRHLNSSILPLPIPRQGAAHDADAAVDGIACAALLRRRLRENRLKEVLPFLPSASADILQEAVSGGRCLIDTEPSDRLMLSKLRTMKKETLAALPGVSEGLENRLCEAIRQKSSLAAVLDAVQTRRYTESRLRRILTAAYLDMPAAWEQSAPPYLRVLGLNERGGELLHRMKHSARLPLFTDPQQPPADRFSEQIFALEGKASDLYGSMLPIPTPCGQEYTTGMLHG